MKSISRFASNKFLVLIMLFALLAILGMSVNFAQINERAIVIAIGFDKSEDGEYIVSMQIVKPQDSAGQATSAADTYVVLTEKSPIATDAIKKLRDATGLYMALSHCQALIFTKATLDDKLNVTLQALVHDWKLPERSVLLCTESAPADILKAQVPVSDSSGLYIQRTISNNRDSIGVFATTVKDVLAESESASATYVITVMDEVLLSEDDLGTMDTNKKADKANFVFERTAAITRGREPVLMNYDATRAVCLVNERTEEGAIVVWDGDVPLLFEFGKLKAKKKYKDGVFEVKLTTSGKLVEVQNSNENMTVSFSAERYEKIIADAITTTVNDVFRFSQEENLDLFRLKNYAYRTGKGKWQDTPDFLQTVSLKLSVKVSCDLS